ncbi:MAG: hypothetical protein MK293_07905 [Pedosphaera sp.]|nr:hypothetical protein [Pedosphaera sp.]
MNRDFYRRHLGPSQAVGIKKQQIRSAKEPIQLRLAKLPLPAGEGERKRCH